jgi:membrane protease YdiL (CAAX protease family)
MSVWKQIGRISALWLAVWMTGSIVAAIISGGWVTYAKGSAPVLAFLFCAPIGEELFFRDVIFELCERALPRWSSAPILLSTVLFSLHHFQFHQFHFASAIGQVAYSFPMGLVFANLRRNSQSVWPGVGLHFSTNLSGVFGA